MKNELLDTESLLAQDAFDDRVHRGEILLQAYKTGQLDQDIFADETCKDFSKMLLDLLALVAWHRVQQAYLSEWPGDIKDEKYTRLAKYLERRSVLIESDEYLDLVSRLSMYKAKGDEDKAKKIIGICTKIIDDELVRSGYVFKVVRDE